MKRERSRTEGVFLRSVACLPRPASLVPPPALASPPPPAPLAGVSATRAERARRRSCARPARRRGIPRGAGALCACCRGHTPSLGCPRVVTPAHSRLHVVHRQLLRRTDLPAVHAPVAVAREDGLTLRGR